MKILILTDRGRWVLRRFRQLREEGLAYEIAWEQADLEAEALYPDIGDQRYLGDEDEDA
jgi:hypothetical protein